jgi:hypothetical protein
MDWKPLNHSERDLLGRVLDNINPLKPQPALRRIGSRDLDTVFAIDQ